MYRETLRLWSAKEVYKFELMYLNTNDMKNFLLKQNEKKESNKLFCSDSNFFNKYINCIWSSNQLITTLFIPVIIFVLSFSTVSAQTVESFDNYIKNMSADESQQLDDLVNGENSTLFIFGNEFEIEGNSSPVIADVALESLNQIYSPNANFENIELIRIKVRNASDLKYILNTGELSHFQKLKYVYVLVTFDICPNNPDDIDCQKSETSKMISFSEETTNPVVLFQLVSLM